VASDVVGGEPIAHSRSRRDSGRQLVGDDWARRVARRFTRVEFTTNDVTGHEPRLAIGRLCEGPVAVAADARWEARAIFTAERARDGDYALNDPRVAAAQAVPTRRATSRGLPIATSSRRRCRSPARARASTSPRDRLPEVEDGGSHRPRLQPCRCDAATMPRRTSSSPRRSAFASAKAAPITLTEHVTMKWQAGVCAVHAELHAGCGEQLLALRAVAVPRFSGQPAFAAVGARRSRRRRLTARPRGPSPHARPHRRRPRDREHKQADLNTFYSPAIAPAQACQHGNDFSDVSPQFALAYRVAPAATLYASPLEVQGGGFNPRHRWAPSRSRGAQLETTKAA